jgi:hypothetical protein
MIHIQAKQKGKITGTSLPFSKRLQLIHLRSDGDCYTTLLDDGITVISTNESPVLKLSSPGKLKTTYDIAFRKVMVSPPHSLQLHQYFYSFEIDCLKSNNQQSVHLAKMGFGFSKFEDIVQASTFSIRHKGEAEKFVDLEYYDHRDDEYFVQSDIDIETALCLTLRNGKCVILAVDESRGENNLIYIGEKNKLRGLGLLRSKWLNGMHIKWIESVLWSLP